MRDRGGLRQNLAAVFALTCAMLLVSAVSAQEQKNRSMTTEPPSTLSKQRQRGEEAGRSLCAIAPQCATGWRAACISRAVCLSQDKRVYRRPEEGCVAYTCLLAQPRSGSDLMKKP